MKNFSLMFFIFSCSLFDKSASSQRQIDSVYEINEIIEDMSSVIQRNFNASQDEPFIHEPIEDVIRKYQNEKDVVSIIERAVFKATYSKSYSYRKSFVPSNIILSNVSKEKVMKYLKKTLSTPKVPRTGSFENIFFMSLLNEFKKTGNFLENDRSELIDFLSPLYSKALSILSSNAVIGTTYYYQSYLDAGALIGDPEIIKLTKNFYDSYTFQIHKGMRFKMLILALSSFSAYDRKSYESATSLLEKIKNASFELPYNVKSDIRFRKIELEFTK